MECMDISIDALYDVGDAVEILWICSAQHMRVE